jgi:hypothetical protein
MALDFSHIQKKIETPETKAVVQHQELMGIVVGEGYAVGRWVGSWGKWIKSSGINVYQMEKLIRKAKSLEAQKKVQACGFVRNRLQKKDWHKWEI